MSQSPAIDWNKAPDNTSAQALAPDIGATNVVPPPAPPATVIEVKTKSFAETVEEEAQNEIATIKMATDRERLNAAKAIRVAELVKELGLPPPKTDDEIIDELCKSKVEQFEMQRLDFRATEKAREIFFDRHPDMRTQERKQNAPEVAQQMSQALLESFLRFLGAEHQRADREARREAAKADKKQ